MEYYFFGNEKAYVYIIYKLACYQSKLLSLNGDQLVSKRGASLAGRTTIIKQFGNRKVILADSVTAATDQNRGDVLVCGSHCGANVGQIAATNKIGAMIGNDAGMGKNNAGIAGLAICDAHDIPAAAVASMSAVIGSGVSTYEEGEVSAVNHLAAKMGVSEGMSAKQAAERFLEKLVKKTTPKALS